VVALGFDDCDEIRVGTAGRRQRGKALAKRSRPEIQSI
jgi:hypothetical protein